MCDTHGASSGSRRRSCAAAYGSQLGSLSFSSTSHCVALFFSCAVWPSSLPGHLYRPAILFACCPITFLFRGIIQLLVWLGGTYGDAAQEAADASKAAHLVDSMTSASTDDLPVTTTAAAEDGLRKRKGAVVGAENRVNTVDLPASPMQPPVSSRTRGKGAN